jgi:hypothetical protein
MAFSVSFDQMIGESYSQGIWDWHDRAECISVWELRAVRLTFEKLAVQGALPARAPRTPADIAVRARQPILCLRVVGKGGVRSVDDARTQAVEGPAKKAKNLPDRDGVATIGFETTCRWPLAQNPGWRPRSAAEAAAWRRGWDATDSRCLHTAAAGRTSSVPGQEDASGAVLHVVARRPCAAAVSPGSCDIGRAGQVAADSRPSRAPGAGLATTALARDRSGDELQDYPVAPAPGTVIVGSVSTVQKTRVCASSACSATAYTHALSYIYYHIAFEQHCYKYITCHRLQGITDTAHAYLSRDV